jgi:hypothetical protein
VYCKVIVMADEAGSNVVELMTALGSIGALSALTMVCEIAW